MHYETALGSAPVLWAPMAGTAACWRSCLSFWPFAPPATLADTLLSVPAIVLSTANAGSGSGSGPPLDEHAEINAGG